MNDIEYQELKELRADSVEFARVMTRLRQTAERLKLGRYGEKLDVIVCEALENAMAEKATLQATPEVFLTDWGATGRLGEP